MSGSIDDNLAGKIVNYILQGLVVVYNIVLLILIICVWKKTDIIIQSTIWLMLLGATFDMSDDIYAYFESDNLLGYSILDTTTRSLIFGGHLILVLQYLYTSCIIPVVI